MKARNYAAVLAALYINCSSLTLHERLPVDAPVWPQWGQNPQRSHYVADRLPWPLQEKWHFRATAAVMPSLVVADDMVFTSSMDGKQETLNLQTGKGMGSIRLRGGLQYTCALADHRMVILRPFDPSNLIAFNLKTGKTIWKKTTHATNTEPLLVDGRIYVAQQMGRLSCFDLENGDKRCEVETKNSTPSTPAYSRDHIVLAGDQGVAQAFTMDLKPVWSRENLGTIRAGVALSDSAVYVGSTEGTFYALNLYNGKTQWHAAISGNIFSPAAVADSMVVFGATDHQLYGLNRFNGEKRWTFKTEAAINTDPVISHDTVIFGTMDKTLYAVDLKDGHEKWRFVGRGRWRGSPIVIKNHLLCAMEDDYLFCFGAP
jgi:eukaryotic-like serine/threonine-protein kinase